PVFWWEPREKPAPLPGAHWLIVMADADWRKKYADAIAAQLGRWDVAEIQGWIDKWSQQIAADVAADPHAQLTRRPPAAIAASLHQTEAADAADADLENGLDPEKELAAVTGGLS